MVRSPNDVGTGTPGPSLLTTGVAQRLAAAALLLVLLWLAVAWAVSDVA